ncbi:MAG: DinB family protein [Flavisolibacter sp.]
MKKFKTEELINQLEGDVRQLIAAAEHLQQADNVKLGYPPEEGKWSAAQSIEHLNMYCRHYLPLIEKAMVHIPKEVNAWFVPGFFGGYFTNMMMPKNVYEIKNKMKAMKAYRPDRGVNVEGVFKEFQEHQHKLLHLLETARKRNLDQVHIPLSVTKLIRLKLGDTFRFLIAHEQRHMIQARNAIRATGVATDKFPVILEAARL